MLAWLPFLILCRFLRFVHDFLPFLGVKNMVEYTICVTGGCVMSFKEEFIEIYRENITRPGADALLDYLEHKCDFFTAPASGRYHGSYDGGLSEHSLNVFFCLK